MSDAGAVRSDDLRDIFAPLERSSGLRRVVIACSGGPDSTALLGLFAEIVGQGRHAEALAATVDHGLRADSGVEAAAVGRFAASLGIDHHTLVWEGRKPRSGVPEASREARYDLLVGLARRVDAQAIVTAHTLDDQAETVLMRLFRGSGVQGLTGMAEHSVRQGCLLLRPFLGVAKARLVATCEDRKWPFFCDPTNENVAYLRPRLRALMPALAQEGLTAHRVSTLAARLRRANEALETLALDWRRRAALGDGAVYDGAFLAQAPMEVLVRFFAGELERARSADPSLPAPRLERIEQLAGRFHNAASAGLDWTGTLGGLTFALRAGRVRVAVSPVRQLRPLSQTKAFRSAALGKDGLRT